MLSANLISKRNYIPHNLDHIESNRREPTPRSLSSGMVTVRLSDKSGGRSAEYALSAQGSHSARRAPESAGKDVLVVEDESYLCDLIADVLETEGHTVRKASNGLEALQHVRERKPDIILLDLMMPIMDGWEFISALKSEGEWAGIPVVIITAIYDVKRTQLDTGAAAVITKPFDIDQLADIVRTYAK